MFRHKKRFGQNFLVDPNIARKIIACAEITPDDKVLEIGPGDGFLTGFLIEKAKHVTAIEIDSGLFEILSDVFKNTTNFSLIHGDCLKIEWNDLPAKPTKLVANIPYNITAPIVFSCIDHQHLFSKIVLMIQKEVCDRIAAKPGTKIYGLFSVVSQTFFDVKYCFTVSQKVFRPRPKVTSAVICLIPKKHDFSSQKDIRAFVDFLKVCFSQRRKVLLNVIAKQFDINKDFLLCFWENNNILPKARAENLSVVTWNALYGHIRASLSSK